MKIDIKELDCSNYKLPNQTTEGELKEILMCDYNEAIELTEEEIIRRIHILKDFILNNKDGEDYKLQEWYAVGNMESNYRFAFKHLMLKKWELL